jgi:intracellular sulfur oxidation DsrE/DsrF family protein
VYDRLTKALVPSASVVPAGVWAVHAIQERRFTYLQTTL